MKSDDLYCNGCKTETRSVFCRNCKIKLCAENKGVDFCFQCQDFPCELIKDFRNDEQSHHSIVLENLKQIKENGIDSWLTDQEIRWTCSECNEKYSWYEEKCANCNSPVKSCLDDERKLKE